MDMDMDCAAGALGGEHAACEMRLVGPWRGWPEEAVARAEACVMMSVSPRPWGLSLRMQFTFMLSTWPLGMKPSQGSSVRDRKK